MIFVIFAINDKNSFEYAKTLIQFIKNNLINNKDLNIILIGNKSDIGEDAPNSIQVPKKEVDQYIYTIENIEFSCKTEKNLETIKKKIEEIEIEEEKDEDDDKIPEEERKKKVNEAKEKSCLIF